MVTPLLVPAVNLLPTESIKKFCRLLFELYSSSEKRKSWPEGRDFQVGNRFEKRLRSATLTIAVLVFFVIVLTQTALFGLLLTGLASLLAALSVLIALTLLSGLSTLLALSELIFLFHIVRHEYPSLIRREPSRASRILSTSKS
jgi:hypothetical protein